MASSAHPALYLELVAVVDLLGGTSPSNDPAEPGYHTRIQDPDDAGSTTSGGDQEFAEFMHDLLGGGDTVIGGPVHQTDAMSCASTGDIQSLRQLATKPKFDVNRADCAQHGTDASVCTHMRRALSHTHSIRFRVRVWRASTWCTNPPPCERDPHGSRRESDAICVALLCDSALWAPHCAVRATWPHTCHI
eukprot:6381585-Prymnesium_polylepis.1